MREQEGTNFLSSWQAYRDDIRKKIGEHKEGGKTILIEDHQPSLRAKLESEQSSRYNSLSKRESVNSTPLSFQSSIAGTAAVRQFEFSSDSRRGPSAAEKRNLNDLIL